MKVEGHNCSAFLDTGSMVSTVSETFYPDHLSHLELHPSVDILQIEGDDEHSKPFSGLIEVDIKIPEMAYVQEAMLLIVHHGTPILFGTNVIYCCLDKLKERSEHAYTRKNIPSGWEVAHRCVMTHAKQLK